MSFNLQGLGGEHLVIADLCKAGHFAFLSAAGMRYDLVADVGGKLLRVQVKSTAQPVVAKGRQLPRYLFVIGRHNEKPISPTEVDLVAFVAFDTGQIAYIPSKSCTGKQYRFTPNACPGSKWSKGREVKMQDFTLEKALKEIL